MAWVDPPSRSTGLLVTSAIWNQDIVANTQALKDPPTEVHNINEASDYTTTGTSFADVDGTDLMSTITTTGGDVVVVFMGNVMQTPNSSVAKFNIAVDGVDDVADDGLTLHDPSTTATLATFPVTIIYLKEGLSAGSHTFKLRWKTTAGGTSTINAGAGTANHDVHPQFWAREVS